MKKTVTLGGYLTLEDFMDVVRYHAVVEFSEEYKEKIRNSRALVEKCVEEERVVYGTTTGFGALVTQTISKDQAEKLQRNIVLTHSTSVGEPFGQEAVRAIMLVVLQSMGLGVSGIRLEVMEMYREALNKNLIPYAPQDGSVGYLCVEGHIASVMIGEGKAYYEGQLYDSRTALSKAGMKPITLSYKEGLSLLNGNISPTALAALAVWDAIRAVKTADVVGAMSLEGLGGLLRAYDPRVMACRPQKEIKETAENVRAVLKGSRVLEACEDSHVQDPLSIRCIPQTHGAAKRIFYNAREVVETELNSCGDNPIVLGNEDSFEAFSNGNPDSSYVGLQMDAACMAAASVAKMSERRNVRFLDTSLSGHPWFLIKSPGLNSGLMIPQYTQAGLLNDMRILCMPASVDSVTTSANQEDYVAMGYNACKKALKVVKNLEYILAIELMSVYQAQQFMDKAADRGQGSQAVLELLGERIPVMEEDIYLYPVMETLHSTIHSGELLEAAEKAVGQLK